MAGFTSVRDVGAGDCIDVGLRNAIANDGAPPRTSAFKRAVGAGVTIAFGTDRASARTGATRRVRELVEHALSAAAAFARR